MKLLKKTEAGRSMIEMLGVLAIVGILSVGGITGYQKASYKLKIIKEMEKYNTFLEEIMVYKDNLLRKRSGNQFTFYAEDAENLRIFPSNWYRKNNMIYDSMQNNFLLYTGSKGLTFGWYLNDSAEQKAKDLLCIALWQDFILPNQDWVYNTWVNGSGTGVNYYGTKTCSQNKKCLRNVTINEIWQFCTSCAEDKVCNIIITFD